MILGDLTLSDNLVLRGLVNSPPVAFSQRRTLGGVSILQAEANQGGRTLTLESVAGDLSANAFTLGELNAIRAMAEQLQTVTMVHHLGTFTVRILSVDDEPSRGVSNPGDDEWYSGTITMIEV